LPELKDIRRRLTVILGVVALAIMILSGPAWALSVDNIRFGVYPDKTRLVLDLSDKADYRVFTTADPWRLVVDLPTFDWQAGMPHGKGVASVRQGNLQDDISRIVFELQNPSVIKNIFFLPRSGKLPNRLVIDLSTANEDAAQEKKDHVFGKLAGGEPAAQAPTEPATAPAPQPEDHSDITGPKSRHARKHVTPADEVANDTEAVSALPHSATPPPPVHEERAPVAEGEEEHTAMLAPPKPPAKSWAHRGEKPLIVIDAGHGGVDPGTIGAGGVQEKNVTLAAARALKKELESAGRYRVLLTRDGDNYLRLFERVKFAREHKADLFISLHADSIDRSNVTGASIYTLSEKASDAEAEKLAMRENRADLIAGVDLSHQDDDVANILVDLAMRDTMNQSRFFANMVADSMESHSIRTLERTNRSAGFAVLKDPDVPSILVEMGFLSNRREAQTLTRPEYQQRLAKTIAASVNSYFTKMWENSRT
jgi:N-acetylmuramoyl-L-alanine amidase